MRYTLRVTKSVDGEMITSIDVPELEVDDVIALSEIDSADLRSMRGVVARVFRLPEKVVGRLTLGDFQGLIEAALSPLAARPGETPSVSPQKSRRSTKPA